MTYWYPGIKELVRIIKEDMGLKAPVILGGIYPSLSYKHAKNTLPVEYIFRNSELRNFFHLVGIEPDYQEIYSTLPEYNLFYHHLDYIVLRTSWGCPFNCSYCAIQTLQPEFFQINYQRIIDFILKYYHQGIKNFVLYDEAFLYNSNYTKNFLKELAKLNLNIKFHTPNALHIRFLDEEIAWLLKKNSFFNPHFGLETLKEDLQKKWGNKVNSSELKKAIHILKKAGFKEGEFSFYLLLGYPGQNLEELKKEIEFLHSQGAKVSLAEFSVTPGTSLFKEYSPHLSEPLLQNNSIFYFLKEDYQKIWRLKNYTRQLNKKFNT